MDIIKLEDCNFSGKCFLPISLGNHWFSDTNLTRLLCYLESKEAGGMFVVADDLYLWSVLGRKNYKEQYFSSKIVNNFLQVKYNVFEFIRKKTDGKAFEVIVWADIWEMKDFRCFYGNYLDWIYSSNDILEALDNFVSKEIHIKGGSIGFQNKYFIEEAAVSVYCNSVICNGIEIYPGADNDFIRFLYKNKANQLVSMLGVDKLRRNYINAFVIVEDREG